MKVSLFVLFAFFAVNANDSLVSCVDRFYAISADSAIKAMLAENNNDSSGNSSAKLEVKIGERLRQLYDSCLTGKELAKLNDRLQKKFRLNCGDISFFAYPLDTVKEEKVIHKYNGTGVVEVKFRNGDVAFFYLARTEKSWKISDVVNPFIQEGN